MGFPIQLYKQITYFISIRNEQEHLKFGMSFEDGRKKIEVSKNEMSFPRRQGQIYRVLDKQRKLKLFICKIYSSEIIFNFRHD